MIVYGLWGLSLQMLVTSGALGVLAFAYYLPLLPFKNKKRIRDIGWLKITVLAVVWTTATAILPIIYWGKPLASYPVEILIRFVFIFILCVLFEIRDVRDDIRNNIHTLPHTVGVGNSYRLINAGLVVFCALSVVQYFRFPVSQRLVGALITAAVTWAVLEYIRRRPSERAYLVLADGVMLVYALLVIYP
jgi:1,4-dihydroxy-2-naphthoate octaprenyltransferase